jgi:hypothetical protein
MILVALRLRLLLEMSTSVTLRFTNLTNSVWYGNEFAGKWNNVRAMTQAVNHRPFTVEVHICARVSPCLTFC